MPSFGKTSTRRIHTLHPMWYPILHEAIRHFDFAVICGHRGEGEQNEAHATGRSQLKWPHSKHNSLPSLAVDLAPYPIDWEDIPRFHFLAGGIIQIANQQKVEIEWGGSWTTLVDLPHFQLTDVSLFRAVKGESDDTLLRPSRG